MRRRIVLYYRRVHGKEPVQMSGESGRRLPMPDTTHLLYRAFCVVSLS